MRCRQGEVFDQNQRKRFGMAELASAEEGVVMEAAAVTHGILKWKSF